MASMHNSKVHFEESTGFEVESGGQISVLSGGDVYIESGGELNVDSGGVISLDEGGVIKFPVLGTTVFASTDVATGTTIPNSGAVVLTQEGTTVPRLFTVTAPVKGCRLDIIVATTASTGSPIEFNLGTGVGVVYAGTTSMQYIIASTDKEPAAYRSLSLVGLSTALWGVVNWVPSSTGWLFAAATS